MSEEKEKLEKQLRFLKESLDAGVISREEYEKGKERVEKKISHLEESQAGQTVQEVPEEQKIEIKGPEEVKPLEEEKIPEKEWVKEAPEEEPSVDKRIIIGVAVAALLLVVFFLTRSPAEGPGEIDAPEETVLEPLCSSDQDCMRQGKIGSCQNPGTADAICVFKDPTTVELTVIETDDCVSCDSSRMINVLTQLFLSLDVENIDYSSAEGRRLAADYGIEVLPAYILGSRVNQTESFDDFKTALRQADDKYVVMPTLLGTGYFINRDELVNTIHIYTLPEDTDKVESNMQELLGLFGDSIEYGLITVAPSEKGQLKQELAITSYPSFIVNNKLKFSGIRSAESIKEKFCELNQLTECSQTLSKDIKDR